MTDTEIAEHCNALHGQLIVATSLAISVAKQLGDALIEAKAQIPKGQWTAWKKDNLTFSLDTAKRYMRIAKQWERIRDKGITSITEAADGSVAVDRQRERDKRRTRRPALPEIQRFDPMRSLKVMGDGDLVNSIAEVMLERPNAVDLLVQVMDRMPNKRRRA